MNKVTQEMDYFLGSEKYQTAFDDYQKSFSKVFLQFYKWINAFLIIDTLFYSLGIYEIDSELEEKHEGDEDDRMELIEMFSRWIVLVLL